MVAGSVKEMEPEHGIAYVRGVPAAPLPPPVAASGAFGWVRANFLATPVDALLSVMMLALLAWLVPPFVEFMVLNAVWSGSDREACLATPERPVVGACWAFVRDRFAYFIYGSYPLSERWRVDLFFVLLASGLIWLLRINAPRRDLGAIYFFVLVPVVSYLLLNGADWLGLRRVDTALWGGMLVTIVVAWVGIVVSLPAGIMLALGRRSRMPAVRLASIIFIEFVRGVPLITVLFMASVMLPLFVPSEWSPDKLLRALVGIALFASAYMAEVVRAGLQAIPKGQFEGAMAVGLSYGQTMRLVILPQALRVTIPNIVNSYIALFKDTTLVFIVGIFDFLKAIEASRVDANWATPVTSATGYAFAAVVYFFFCYLMSSYAKNMEARLGRAEQR